VVDEECDDAARLREELVGRWLSHRNDVSALTPLWRAGVVVDTIEIAARWAVLPALADEVVAALSAVPGTLAASVHESHAYGDGACLYFTFAGRRPEGGGGAGAGGGERVSAETRAHDAGGDGEPGAGEMAWEEAYYRRAWETAVGVVESHGGAISHHHGIGLNRSRFLPGALGVGFSVLADLKGALDPTGIMNPGKLGLPARFGEVPWR